MCSCSRWYQQLANVARSSSRLAKPPVPALTSSTVCHASLVAFTAQFSLTALVASLRLLVVVSSGPDAKMALQTPGLPASHHACRQRTKKAVPIRFGRNGMYFALLLSPILLAKSSHCRHPFWSAACFNKHAVRHWFNLMWLSVSVHGRGRTWLSNRLSILSRC